jgi:hypothetical protein
LLSPTTFWTRWRPTACQAGPAAPGLTSDGLEGYARTFPLAAFRIAGAGGEPAALIEQYADGLTNGTEPRGRRHAGGLA